jgi:hypothetical protein
MEDKERTSAKWQENKWIRHDALMALVQETIGVPL